VNLFDQLTLHPALYSTVMAIILGSWILFLFGSGLLAIGVASVAGGTNWLVWRRGGPGHNWRKRLLEWDRSHRRDE
jgi:hypothetical protein